MFTGYSENYDTMTYVPTNGYVNTNGTMERKSGAGGAGRHLKRACVEGAVVLSCACVFL